MNNLIKQLHEYNNVNNSNTEHSQNIESI
jgi:hypothetical protein